jgi:hypothetical protein
MKNLEEAARKFIAFAERRNITYALVGGFAARLYGLPRATYDVDFAISIDRDVLDEFYAAAEAEGYEIPEFQRTGWSDGVGRMSVVKIQCRFDDHLIDLDLFLANSPFLRSVLSRRQLHNADGFSAWYATPEDIILLKLDANRSKDRGDIEDILLVQGQLDEVYLRKWAAQFKTVHLLDEVLERARE